MFAQFLPDFSQQKVCFAQVLAFTKVAKMEGEVFVALRASQGDLEPSRRLFRPSRPVAWSCKKKRKKKKVSIRASPKHL